MVVKRIVSNIPADSIALVRAFYVDLFDLQIVMDHGWIVTLASGESAVAQVSIASEGGSGTPAPDLSIEVDDVDAVCRRARQSGHEIVYGPIDEAWGVRRFFVRDPVGKLPNVLSHRE